VLPPMMDKGRAAGIETRGISDHGFIHSIYFRDPNGYVVELTARMPNHAQAMDPARNEARVILDHWQAGKEAAR
jgi:catechol-2,3-dioxygenase